jgi:hypothetical protein
MKIFNKNHTSPEIPDEAAHQKKGPVFYNYFAYLRKRCTFAHLFSRR